MVTATQPFGSTSQTRAYRLLGRAPERGGPDAAGATPEGTAPFGELSDLLVAKRSEQSFAALLLDMFRDAFTLVERTVNVGYLVVHSQTPSVWDAQPSPAPLRVDGEDLELVSASALGSRRTAVRVPRQPKRAAFLRLIASRSPECLELSPPDIARYRATYREECDPYSPLKPIIEP